MFLSASYGYQVQSEKFHKGIEKSNISNKIRKKRLELWVDYIRQI
jgi:hypothetical protein